MISAFVAAIASIFPGDYPGYITVHERNLSYLVNYGSLDPMNWLGSKNIAADAKMVCDSWSGCSAFDGVNFYYYGDVAHMTTYLSRTYCGEGSVGVNVSGGCVPGSRQTYTYWHCPTQGATFQFLATFTLPPDDIAEACDQNPFCIAFTIQRVGTEGTLWGAGPAPNKTVAPTFIGLHVKDPSTPVDQPHPTSVQGAPAAQYERVKEQAGDIPVPAGYASFPLVDPLGYTPIAIGGWPNTSFSSIGGWSMGEPVAWSFEGVPTWFGGSHSLANPNACFSSTELAVILAGATKTVNSGVYTFIDQPMLPPLHTTGPGGGYSFYQTWNTNALRENANSTMFVNINSSSPCTRTQGDCGAGELLKCSGLNTSANLIPLYTYPLPAEIIAQACTFHGCHVFVMNKENTKGTTYKWPGAAVNSSVTGYLRDYRQLA